MKQNQLGEGGGQKSKVKTKMGTRMIPRVWTKANNPSRQLDAMQERLGASLLGSLASQTPLRYFSPVWLGCLVIRCATVCTFMYDRAIMGGKQKVKRKRVRERCRHASCNRKLFQVPNWSSSGSVREGALQPSRWMET